MLASCHGSDNASYSRTFISEVVSQTQDKLRCLALSFTVLFNQTLGNLALVDKLGADLQVGLARHDLDIILLGNSVLQLSAALVGLVHTPVWVCTTVMPGQSNLLAFNETALSALCVVLEGVDDLLLPRHIFLLGQVLPVLALRPSSEM
jgi:hypothetical protein